MSDVEFELRAKLAGTALSLQRAQAEVARVAKDRRADVEAIRARHHCREDAYYDHRSMEYGPGCNYCGTPWPCPDAVSLDADNGEAAAGGDAA